MLMGSAEARQHDVIAKTARKRMSSMLMTEVEA